MAKLIKQKDNLCALYALFNIFHPEGEPMIGHFVDGFKLDSKDGMTLVEENRLLSIITRGSLQLVPWYFNPDVPIEPIGFLNKISIVKKVRDDEFLCLALMVESKFIKNKFHRIWILVDSSYTYHIVDTQYDNTITSTVACRNPAATYNIHGVFNVYYTEERREIFLQKEKFKHLFG